MIPIISFPSNGYFAERHRAGLQKLGELFWVGYSAATFLRLAGDPFTSPDLMIVDTDSLDHINKLGYAADEYKFLHTVPALIVEAQAVSHLRRSAVNIVGRIPPEDQYEPDQFARHIEAFYLAGARGPVTQESHEQALAKIDAARRAGRPLSRFRRGAIRPET